MAGQTRLRSAVVATKDQPGHGRHSGAWKNGRGLGWSPEFMISFDLKVGP